MKRFDSKRSCKMFTRSHKYEVMKSIKQLLNYFWSKYQKIWRATFDLFDLLDWASVRLFTQSRNCTYGLLNKCKVKMAGYWSSSYFAISKQPT